MTVVVPPQGLRRQEDISPAEREELVMAYTKAPYGTKKAVAAAACVNPEWIRNWCAALADGDLASGRIPRHTGTMTTRDVAEIERLRAQLAHREQELAASQEEVERLTQQMAAQAESAKAADASWRKAVEGLGKAIEIMQTSTRADAAGDN